jgi:hypothetical protein
VRTAVGKEVCVTDWVTVDQQRIDKFAEAPVMAFSASTVEPDDNGNEEGSLVRAADLIGQLGHTAEVFQEYNLAFETVLHLGNTAFEPCCQSFVGQSRPDDGDHNLVQVGQALYGVGERFAHRFQGLRSGFDPG